jgi:PAS domain S-box-containing protein
MIERLMGKRSLGQSFAVSTALLVVVLTGVTLVVVERRVVGALRQGLIERGRSIARSIAAVATPSLLAYNYPALQIAAAGAAEDPGIVYVVIHDREGAVAGEAGDDVEGKKGASRLPAIPREPRHLVREFVNSEGDRSRVLEVAMPVYVEEVAEPWGVVRVGLSFDPLTAAIRNLALHLIIFGLTFAAVAVACGIWVAGKITAPLRGLVKGTEALSSGDTTHRIPVGGARELADLARAFNVMMDRLEEKAKESAAFESALESLNSSLEQQVLDRTRALEESEAQYKTLVEHSPDAIIIVQDEHVRFVNPSFCALFGITEEQALEETFDIDSIFEPSAAAIARGRMAAWQRGETPEQVEVLGRDAEGRPRHLELRGSRIEHLGKPAAECLLIDTTETKRLQERLAQNEKLRALGELAGGVAHDFNNLLGAILGRIQLLRRQGFDADVDRDLAVIEKAAQDGRETIRRIQEFSRRRRDRKFSPVDLGEVLRDSLEITRTRWKSEAERRNVVIRTSIDVAPVPPMMGSPSELREVFTNLILNAVDAMPQGGSLCLSCRQKDDRVVAEVTDTGVGMTETIRRQLFDPFFTTKGSRGMGLGMSVVYGIVTRHEGKIDVTTAIGKGTAFRLDFPVADVPLHAAGSDGAALPQILRPGRILVIDDEPEVANVVRDVLIAEGHIVDVAVFAEDGVKLATVSDYDAVFTDLGMPDMSGWEVAERILAVRQGLPIALVTGWGTSLDEVEAHRRGISAIVHKPFDISDISRVAIELVSKSVTTRKPTA